jgi:hypothetical protein
VSPSTSRYTATIVRDLDDTRIAFEVEAVSGAERLAISIEQQALPGKLVSIAWTKATR